MGLWGYDYGVMGLWGYGVMGLWGYGVMVMGLCTCEFTFFDPLELDLSSHQEFNEAGHIGFILVLSDYSRDSDNLLHYRSRWHLLFSARHSFLGLLLLRTL